MKADAMEEPSYAAATTLDPYAEEAKTYVELEVVHRNPNPYDSVAIQLAQQSDLLFNYDSSPNASYPMVSSGSNHHPMLQYHELQPPMTRDCRVGSFESIRSVLMLKDSSEQYTLSGSPQLGQASTTTETRIKSEQDEPPLPFWKERALQIERGTEICMHHSIVEERRLIAVL